MIHSGAVAEIATLGRSFINFTFKNKKIIIF